MKTAIVTGANRGLGLGFTQVLANKGFKVYAAMRQATDLPPVNENVIPVELDVSDDESMRNLTRTIQQNGDTITLLINNAGVNKDSVSDTKDKVCKLDALDRLSLNTMFDVNATSPLLMAQHIVPLMKDGGLVLNISSCRASFHDHEENSTANYGYRASKVALNMFTQALSEDLPNGIVTVAVHPGGVLTDMNPAGPTDPIEAASEIVETFVEHWRPEMNGGFYNRDGSEYPR